MRVYTSGVGSAVLASATADAAGSFSATASAPQSVNGPRIFVSVGESSGMLGAASFWMEARLILATVAQCYTLSPEPAGEIAPMQIVTVRPRRPVRMRLRRRAQTATS